MLALFAILRASGVEITDDMEGGVMALVLILCGVPFVSGLVTRWFVYSPNSTKEIADDSYEAGKFGTPKPTL